MIDIDEKIRDALKAEEAELFAEYEGEQGIFEMIAGVFRGKLRWLIVVTTVAMIVMFAAGIYAGFQFFEAEDMREMIAWSMAFLFCMLGVTIMKMWFWMEINKNTITREIKRLELQISSLAGKLERN